MTTSNEVKRARELLRAGSKREARELLIEYLRREPRSAAGWYLLSFTLQDRGKQRECLQRALRINPDMKPARERLSSLEGAAPRRTPAQQAGAPSRGVVRSENLNRGLSNRAKLGIGAGVFLFVVAGLIGGVAFVRLLGGQMSTRRAEEATAQAATRIARETLGAAVGLPPTWTPTATEPPAATATITPSPSFTPTPSPIPPDPTTAAEMSVIQQQVSDLRGLPMGGQSQSYVITSSRVRPILEASFMAGGGSQDQVDDQARVLTAFGLIKPTYDLYTNILNGLTDSLGGFYLPWSEQVFVIGSRFSGVERWIYSHEYAHALVDHHHDVRDLGVYPLCELSQDRCNAIQALVEGDATLVMTQWLEQYASPQDFEDITSYNPPSRTLPDQFPPPYVGPDSSFPYSNGLTFVEQVYQRGNWAQVDTVYANPPDSTEQILHPDKYFAGEAPLDVPTADLAGLLGDEWRVLDQNTLGEWTTFLLLGFGADLPSQIEVAEAEQAAAGWGGDRYVVYYQDEADELVLVARWAWDSVADASQFARALRSAQDGRHRGHNVDLGRGDCWDTGEQVSCVLATGSETLWLLTPSPNLMEQVQARFPNFN